MPNIMTTCPNGHTFPSGISMGQGSTATLAGNSSRCPTCGLWAPIPDGFYVAGAKDIVNYLTHSGFTAEDIVRLRDLLAKEQEKGSDPKKIGHRIVKKDPRFWKLREFAKQHGWGLVLQIVGIVVALIIAQHFHRLDAMTNAQTQQLLQGVLDEMQKIGVP